MPDTKEDPEANALAPDDPYTGTDPIYQNHAYDETKPTPFEGAEAVIADRVAAEDEARASRSVFINQRGDQTSPVHPSERVTTGFVAATPAPVAAKPAVKTPAKD